MTDQWVKLQDCGPLEGTVISAMVRDKNFDGVPVIDRKTLKPYRELCIAVQKDDGITQQFVLPICNH